MKARRVCTTSSVARQQLLKENILSVHVHQVHLEVIQTLRNPCTRQVTPAIKALSSAEAPHGKFLNNIGFGEGCTENNGKRHSRHFPHTAVFPLPRPTAKKPLRSKQHERGLCGGESHKRKQISFCTPASSIDF